MKRSDKSCGALNGAKHFLQLIWFCRQEKISFETQHSIGSAKAAFAITGTEYDILQMQPPELSRSFCRRRHLNFDRKAPAMVYLIRYSRDGQRFPPYQSRFPVRRTRTACVFSRQNL
jgi:hypothetical protein